MIEMRGPTDPDNFRVKAGRFGDRFYTDPLPADDTWSETTDDDVYPAISTVKKADGQDWSRAMAKRLAKAPSQLVEIGKLESEFERKERLNLLSDVGLDGASSRGTIVHQHAEALLMNRLPIYQLNDQTRPYIRMVDVFFATYAPRLWAAEFVAMHRSLNNHNLHRCDWAGYGGTGDAVVEIDGKLWLIDWKSRAEDSEHKAYPAEAAQVSAYGKADYWIVGADNAHGAMRVKPPELAGGLIVSIKPDSYECYPIDLDKGFDYWCDLHAWWQAERNRTKAIGRKWAARVAPTSSLVADVDAFGPHGDDAIEHAQVKPPAAACGAYPGCVENAGCNPEVRCDGHGAPTVGSNKSRFAALSEAEKVRAREMFTREGLNPNSKSSVTRVAAIIAGLEARPGLREMQEQRATTVAEHSSVPEQVLTRDMMLADEGGLAPDEMINEARLMYELALTSDGKTWTAYRVAEAKAASLSIQVSQMASVKRAHLYLALLRWAIWRGERLIADEAENNDDFAVLLNLVAPDTASETLGFRLASLTTEQAVQFDGLVVEVVESETGEQLPTESASQPASQPANETEE